MGAGDQRMISADMSERENEEGRNPTPPAGEITLQEILRRLSEPDFTLVDVMPSNSFDAGHIPRSVSLPVAEIAGQARQLFPNLSREIVIYCSGPT